MMDESPLHPIGADGASCPLRPHGTTTLLGEHSIAGDRVSAGPRCPWYALPVTSGWSGWQRRRRSRSDAAAPPWSPVRRHLLHRAATPPPTSRPLQPHRTRLHSVTHGACTARRVDPEAPSDPESPEVAGARPAARRRDRVRAAHRLVGCGLAVGALKVRLAPDPDALHDRQDRGAVGSCSITRLHHRAAAWEAGRAGTSSGTAEGSPLRSPGIRARRRTAAPATASSQQPAASGK